MAAKPTRKRRAMIAFTPAELKLLCDLVFAGASHRQRKGDFLFALRLKSTVEDQS